MGTYIALLRAVNLGGGSTILMEALRSLCAELGFTEVRTYIQSGNVLFKSALGEASVIKKLEEALQARYNKKIPVIVRSLKELGSVVSRNPFPSVKPSLVGVLFLLRPAPEDLAGDMDIQGPEEVVVSGREIFIHYPSGMGRSKLKIPKVAREGTMRNINTISKLVKLGTDL